MGTSGSVGVEDLRCILWKKLEEKKDARERNRKELEELKAAAKWDGRESRILNRIAVLKSESLWSECKKGKIGIKKAKAHWDYVLEEMSWLSSVFVQERKTKKFLCKKCGKMIQKHFSEKALNAHRAEKAHEQGLKKTASFLSREIRQFWGNVEKLFEFRLKKKIEVMRKKALDQHLNFIVDKTEKYSSMLAESLTIDSSRKTTPSLTDEDEEDPRRERGDYRPDSSSEDDEETIALDEKNHDQDQEEIDRLKNESEMPIEELLRKYYSSEPSEVQEPLEEENKKNENSESEKEETEDKEDRSYTLKSLMNKKEEEEGDFNNVIEMAAKFQPTGNTLATTTVKTPVPFILKHSLREYQHIGLDWLVTLQDRKLNGILADEMGLGKTIQTIAFLAHMACEKQLWGPHLIVVPTSVMLNWEMEIKKWAPSFKVLTYYGSQKERRIKRIGWTKPNAFHICITSYKLVVQDHVSFRRKKWRYFILDEAQHIKNFKSQRWQMLLNFSCSGRLLLTGTPLQNNLMELWSLMHFLMPNVFESHRDFKEWFSNPLTGMVEGSAEYNDGLVKRLHKVLRPFLLRRLKNEVEKQLPKKFEHIIRCKLSKRQRYLYDDFMSRAQTKETLECGNFLNVINVLMQLRKVCNHPNLFEQRPTVSPFVDSTVDFSFPRLIMSDKISPLLEDLVYHPLLITSHEFTLTAYASFSINRLKMRKLKYVVRSAAVPVGKLKLTVKDDVQSFTTSGQSFISMKSLFNNNRWLENHEKENKLTLKVKKGVYVMYPSPRARSVSVDEEEEDHTFEKTTFNGIAVDEEEQGRLERFPAKKGIFTSSLFISKMHLLQSFKEKRSVEFRLQNNARSQLNRLKCEACPIYGRDLIHSLSFVERDNNHFPIIPTVSYLCQEKSIYEFNVFPETIEDTIERMKEFLDRFVLYIPKCTSVIPSSHCLLQGPNNLEKCMALVRHNPFDVSCRFSLQLPETRLIQYDCGKLQVLQKLLHKLKSDGSRVLIFTQMTRILDVLEVFLNYHGHIYLRLDGSTKVEQRQSLMERFNGDKKYFCFILSTRSGGVGINLTGANSVVFYDSDWNPTMDAQAQDRCHRIGQTRDVHIYRLISEKTIEENILKKANQKRLLGDLAIEGGSFTTATLKKQTIKDLFSVNNEASEGQTHDEEASPEDSANAKIVGAFESAISAVEDDTDIQALKLANKEVADDEAEFDEVEASEKNEVDEQIRSLLDQLTAVERYALSHIEHTEREWSEQQISQAETEIEEQKRELNAKKIDELTEQMNDSTEEEDD